MSGEERRNCIIHMLETEKSPVSGTALAKQLSVSRQVIVQDIAIIRANGYDITATHRGYILHARGEVQRVFKVNHTDDRIEDELLAIVDLGGIVRDVFIYHKVYGVIRAEMNLKSRRDVKNYMTQIHTGTSAPLKNITSGYHYHTVEAESTELLDLIQEKLQEEGFLAPLRDYEPVQFGSFT